MKKAIVFLCVISLLVSMAGCKSKKQKPVVPDVTTQVMTTPETTTTTLPATTAELVTTNATTTTAPPRTTKRVITKSKTTQAATTAIPVTTQPVETETVTIPTTVTVPETTSETTGSVTGEDTCTGTTELQLFAAKPVIYLYPTEKTDVKVSLDFDGELTCTYPEYNDSWNVSASPDGTIIDKVDGKEYSYLFWEGTSNTQYDLSKGFVVKGSDTADFLQKKLTYLGLTPKEYNEFIVYWLPKMQDNKYNLITFQGDAYTNSAKLEITPKPDSILRVFMVYKPLEKSIEVKEQELSPFERKGFSVVEWGGTSINN